MLRVCKLVSFAGEFTLLVLPSALWAIPQAPRVDELKHAAALMEAHDLTVAEPILQSLIKVDPTDAVALNLLGLVKVQQQKSAEAERLFLRSIDAGHGILGPYLNLARLYGSARPLEAITQLQAVFERSPNDTQAQALLRTITTAAAAQSKDKQVGIALLQRACALQPSDPELRYSLGLAALETRQWKLAASAFDEAVAAGLKTPEIHYARARLFLEQSLGPQAESEMRAYLAQRPQDASAQYGLGYILMAEQRSDEAKAAFEQSIKLQPQQTESLFQLGELAVENGHREIAMENFEAVLTRDPQHAGALTGMGVLAYGAGRYEDARKRLEAAIRSAPDYQKAHYYLALTLSRTGAKARAETEFARAQQLQKPHLTSLQ